MVIKTKGGENMGKYLTLWDNDLSRIPEDPKEQLALYSRLLEAS